MFTGIVEERGQVLEIRRRDASIQLDIQARTVARGLRLGASLAVNGCCLTLVARRRNARGARLRFDLLQETWDRTSFRALEPGRSVNLERALAVNGRLDGHFVTGHIDGVGRITGSETRDGDHVLTIEAPPEVAPYLLFKGSIAVDGISLTVARVARSRFDVCVIPHTWSVTNLAEKRAGSWVNLEADILGKYVERLLGKSAPAILSRIKLRER
ncbi:MAG: riboflavin synthase [Verrucomicrobia bacterium]|nr:riboflavin synthase [Verrucomicrobiota bacterium]